MIKTIQNNKLRGLTFKTSDIKNKIAEILGGSND